MQEPIAVLMYHSVAPALKSWDFSYLSLPPALFEDHVATLKRAGYTSITLSQLYDYISGRIRLPHKSIAITFDDGYLDSWVFAFPVLKKYGFTGTVFISTDFIDRGADIRPNTDDVEDGRLGRDDLDWRGFLSPAEMRRMADSQVIDVQAHGKTHTWYFTSGEIVDFHRPGDGYPWLGWNARPDRKPMYLAEDQTDFVPLGSPVYSYAPALVARRYFPDPRVEAELAAAVRDLGGRAFFENREWRGILKERASALVTAGVNARLESDAERLTRLREEIVLAKRELSQVLGRPVEFLCWPNGEYDEDCVNLAREAGFKAWTLRSRERHVRRNLPGEDPRWIRRLDVSPWWYCRWRKVCHVDGGFLERQIADYKGFALSGFKLKWYKMEKFVESLFGGR